jgi:hypothetical protein
LKMIFGIRKDLHLTRKRIIEKILKKCETKKKYEKRTIKISEIKNKARERVNEVLNGRSNPSNDLNISN